MGKLYFLSEPFLESKALDSNMLLKKIMSIRNAYEKYGVKAFYKNFGDNYRNPHEAIIFKIINEINNNNHNYIDFTKVLDLASGSGEVTLALKKLAYNNVDGIEPYTNKAYFERTGKQAEKYFFEDIEQGVLLERFYTTIICSFALHLAEPSRLPILLYQLSRIAPSLLIITPHKKPVIKSEWGWTLLDELIIERVRGRIYQSVHSGEFKITR
jgi:SAM-dependent methyltransferase